MRRILDAGLHIRYNHGSACVAFMARCSEATMKLLRVHSFHVVVAILCCSVLYTGTLQASTGGHKYHDPTALEYLQRIVDHYLGLDATGPYDLPAHP